jgi:hypothetical protein
MAILALMLLTSHVALISHVTAHFEPDVQRDPHARTGNFP